MNKISVPTAVTSGLSLREAAPTPARSAMNPPELTPLPLPGSARRSADAAGTGASSSTMTGWRNALFDRAFEDLQLKLAERRRAGPEAHTIGGLDAAERRDSDTALQWISACLMSAREP